MTAVVLVACTRMMVPIETVARIVGVCDPTVEDGMDADFLPAVAGKLCYRSFGVGDHNILLTRSRTDLVEATANLLRQGHHSVLEHVSATFLLTGVSRVMTHELVRHRHMSPSQLSGRFVWPAEPEEPVLPSAMPDELRETAVRTVAALRHWHRVCSAWLRRRMDDGMPFAERKRVASLLRRLLPQATPTDILVTGNLRAWREAIAKRCTQEAEEEIRDVMAKVARALKAVFPACMQDMRIGDDGIVEFDR